MLRSSLIFLGGLVAGILFSKAIVAVILFLALLFLIIGRISKND